MTLFSYLIGTAAAIIPRWFPDEPVVCILNPWIILTAFLLTFRRECSKRNTLLFLAFWCVSYAVRYGQILGPYYMPFAIMLCTAAALIYTVPFFLDRWFRRYYQGPISIFMFPFSFTALDYILELTGAGSLFTFSLTQFDNKPLLQIASVLGCKGITFILTLTASVIAYGIEKRVFAIRPKTRPGRRQILVVWSCIAIVVLIHIGGCIRIARLSPRVAISKTVPAAWSGGDLVNDDFLDIDYGDDGEDPAETVEDRLATHASVALIKAVNKTAEEGISLLCFPEECFYISQSYLTEFLDTASFLAKENDMCILLPVEAVDFDDPDIKSINAAYFIDANGEVLAEYKKSMLIPFMESFSYQAGNGDLPNLLTRIGDTDVGLSYAICFDGDFSYSIRNLPEEARLFIDISWDWDVVDYLHYRIIGLRAVENGVTVFKPTAGGFTTVTDMVGRIHSRTHTDDTGYDNIQKVSLPMASCVTIYQRFGFIIDAFSFVGTGIAFLFLIKAIRSRKSNTSK